MNQAVTAPATFTPASCPLLAAVLPVRYAIGPVDPVYGASTVDATHLGLPAVSGHFPELGPDHPQLSERTLGYVPRMLRDGWLYLWQNELNQLSEYQIESASLLQTERGGPALSKKAAYLLLPAGVPVGLVWSPERWSDKQFAAVKSQAVIRQRIMRTITPGLSPLSGQVSLAHQQLGDNAPQNYAWSCVDKPGFWMLNDPPLRSMRRCEQQHYAIVDDPWGVLLDLAALLRARNKAYDKLCHHRRDEWATAAVLRSLSEDDPQLRKQLPAITDHASLQRALNEQDREAEAIDRDRGRLASLWAEWFATLGGEGPATLETACGHFDITQPEARNTLEASFAAACLGPSATGIGAKVIEQALNPESSTTDKPWLLWAVLGLTQRIGGAELKQLLHVAENTEPAAPQLQQFARAISLTTAINLGANKLEQRLPMAKAGEALFAAMAPVLGGRLRTLAEHLNDTARNLLIAMLTRSQQRLDVLDLSPRQSMLWLTEQMNQAQNKSQRRRWQKELERLEQEETRAAKAAAPQSSFTAVQVRAATPHLRVVPKQSVAPAHPVPGYGSDIPVSQVKSPPSTIANLPPLLPQATRMEMPKNIGQLLNEAPLKTLIAVAAAWNLYEAEKCWQKESSRKNIAVGVSSGFAFVTAGSAIVQKLAEVDWKAHTISSGLHSENAQKLLANALLHGSTMVFIQSITAGLDTLIFGWEALDAYKAGDLDTTGINVGLSAASFAYMRVSIRMFRALRIARAAVIAGQAAALGRGTAVIPVPLLAQSLGLTITIFGGLFARLYTKDTPLERWVKQTCFGTRPANWSGSYDQTLIAFYQAMMPVKMELQRWTDYNPHGTGAMVNEIRLFLTLPGQAEYRQGMLSFSGSEEWEQDAGLLSFGPARGICKPLTWSEEERIPFDVDTGSRITPELGGGIRLRRAYHETETLSLKRISGSLIYQPIDGLFLPPIDIDLS